MKILLLSTDFLPRIGGVSLMMHYLANAMVDHGAEVLVAPPPADGEIQYQQHYKVSKGDREPWTCGSTYDRFKRERRFRFLISSLVEQFAPDAMLLGDQVYSGQYAKTCTWAKSRYQLPMGVYCHGLDVRSKMRPAGTLRRTWRPLAMMKALMSAHSKRQRARELLSYADIIFTNSSYTANLVRQWTGRDAIPTGCGLSDKEWRRELTEVPEFDVGYKRTLRRSLGLPDKGTVCFVGRLVPRKNLGLLIKSLESLPDVQAVIVGDGEERGHLEEYAQLLGVDDRMFWLGEQGEAIKWRALRASDALCLPAIESPDGGVEGFGIVLLEATAAGTPVIAAASGGMTDVVSHEQTGLLCSGADPQELAHMIDRLIHDRSLAATCVANGRQLIEKQFNWKHVAEHVLRAFHSSLPRVVAKRPPLKLTQNTVPST